MHMSRSFGMGAAIACGLESVPGSCVCPTANSSALTQAYYPPQAVCTEFFVPVTFEFENVVFNFPKWDDDFALEDFLAVATTRASQPRQHCGRHKERDGDEANRRFILYTKVSKW